MTHHHPIALITGAGKRIGKAIALTLAHHGWDIAIHYHHSQSDALSTQLLIEQMGRQAICVQCDLGDTQDVASLSSRVQQQLGHPTLLVNNASLFEYDNPEQMNVDLFDQHMTINVKAPILLSEAFYKTQKANNQQGVIVHLLDQKLVNPNPDYLSYTLSKAALSASIPLLALHYAPFVRVMGIAPGLTLPSGPQSVNHFNTIQTMNPLGHSPTPEDIAKSVLYIAEVNSLTGSTIYVDAGQHLVPSKRDVMFIDPNTLSG